MKAQKIYYKRPLAKFKGARLAWDYFQSFFMRHPANVLSIYYKKGIWFANLEHKYGNYNLAAVNAKTLKND